MSVVFLQGDCRILGYEREGGLGKDTGSKPRRSWLRLEVLACALTGCTLGCPLVTRADLFPAQAEPGSPPVGLGTSE